MIQKERDCRQGTFGRKVGYSNGANDTHKLVILKFFVMLKIQLE